MDDKPSSRSSFPRYIQDVLSFEGWKEYPQFATRHVSSFFNDRFSSFELLHLFLMIRQSHSLSVTSALSCLICTQTQGLGRNVLLGSILSSCLGGHVFAALALSLDKLAILQQHDLTMLLGQARMDLIWQWCVYVVAICTFHLLEFSVTAVYNPTEASSDSFLVNHSQSYTIAVVSSSAEFWVRFLFFPSLNAPQYIVALALALVICSQMIRSVAMATAGASFNHIIQTSKKESHVLITNGIYSILRHPSYVGFFYWSVSTQFLLGNYLHAVLFAAASWLFFRKRIPFEEESLCRLFPDQYPGYVSRTRLGIPFLLRNAKS